MSDVARLIARAEQAERLAADMTSEDHRDQLLGIAAEWRRMAKHAAAEEERSFGKRAAKLAPEEKAQED